MKDVVVVSCFLKRFRQSDDEIQEVDQTILIVPGTRFSNSYVFQDRLSSDDEWESYSCDFDVDPVSSLS